MNNFRWLSPLLLFFIFSCDKPLPDLEGIDLEGWRDDRNACKNIRKSMKGALEEEMEKLLALNQMQIVNLLGRPDQNELSTRNQKFFYYYIDPAPACGVASDSASERLVIRFNAVGLAKEISVESL